MTIKNNIKTLLTTIVLLTFLWAAFLITQLISKDPEHKNEFFIPESASFAIKLDSRKLVNKALFTILFEGRDEKIVEKIRELLSNPRESKKEIGINLLSDAVVFASPFKNGKIVVIALNLSNPSDFETNILEHLNEKQVVEVIDNVGFILTYFSNEEMNTIDKREIATYFEKNIRPLSENSTSRFTRDIKDGSFLQSYSKKELFGKDSYFTTSNSEFFLAENGIDLKSELGLAKKITNPANKILIPRYGNFHFTSGIVPPSLQDSLSAIAGRLGLKLPALKSCSINYGGINIQSNDDGMTVLPEIDLLLEFKSSFTVEDLFKQDTILKKIGGTFENKIFKIGGKRYYYDQIDSKTICISSFKSTAIIKNKNQELIAVKGNLASLLKIEGGGMIITLLYMIPAYKASKELFTNIDDVNISLNKSKGNTAKMKGSITFKKDHFVMNEMLKFALEMQLILN